MMHMGKLHPQNTCSAAECCSAFSQETCIVTNETCDIPTLDGLAKAPSSDVETTFGSLEASAVDGERHSVSCRWRSHPSDCNAQAECAFVPLGGANDYTLLVQHVKGAGPSNATAACERWGKCGDTCGESCASCKDCMNMATAISSIMWENGKYREDSTDLIREELQGQSDKLGYTADEGEPTVGVCVSIEESFCMSSPEGQCEAEKCQLKDTCVPPAGLKELCSHEGDTDLRTSTPDRVAHLCRTWNTCSGMSGDLSPEDTCTGLGICDAKGGSSPMCSACKTAVAVTLNQTSSHCIESGGDETQTDSGACAVDPSSCVHRIGGIFDLQATCQKWMQAHGMLSEKGGGDFCDVIGAFW
eukprot:evm.model.scf_1703.3 EVM.evm.TU.scf_1703.3   scf_1703:21216-24805(-)